MKCPACGFTTEREQDWCDFCKEPFPSAKKRRDSPKKPDYDPPLMPPPLYKGSKDVDPSDPALRAVSTMKDGSSMKKVESGIPMDFARLDSGGDVPVVSNTTRYILWAGFALLVVLAVAGVVALVTYTRQMPG